jgi:hypothetical protein
MLPKGAHVPAPCISLDSARTIHLTTESSILLTQQRLEMMGAYSGKLATWQKGNTRWLPLLEGKAIDQFNHRYAHVKFSKTNVSGQGNEVPSSVDELADTDFRPLPRYWVEEREMERFPNREWFVVFRDTANVNNERTSFAAIVPRIPLANTLNHALFKSSPVLESSIFVSAINSYLVDYVARNKIQARHLNWFIAEQLPIPNGNVINRTFGKLTAGDIIKDHVLRLSYSSHDMAPFARDADYVYRDGTVKPPIIWNEVERRHLRARLDALFFILYGVTDEADIGYILSTFPIVERTERKAADGVYLTRELILWYKRSLLAGDPDAVAPEAEVIRGAKARGD